MGFHSLAALTKPYAVSCPAFSLRTRRRPLSPRGPAKPYASAPDPPPSSSSEPGSDKMEKGGPTVIRSSYNKETGEFQLTRRDQIINGLFLAAAVPIVYDLIQDLGVDFGDDAQPVPGADSIPGVGTKYKVALFAGGCFWCMEAPFDRLGDGVIATISGYTGGSKDRPTYREVSSGITGHAETVQVVYDPTLVSYDDLLNAYWHSIDPTTVNRQFVDEGTQYRSAIYYTDDEQKQLAEASIAKLEKANTFGAPIVTEVTKADTFWPAERYHQDYYKKKPNKYGFYRSLSGRDEYIQEIWGPAYLMSSRK